MIFKSKRYPDVEIPNVGVYQYVTSNPNKISDDKVIFIDGITDEKVTFGELKRDSKRFAAGLQDKIGFKRHDVLGIFSPNQINYPVVVFGTLAAGGSVTTVNPKNTAGEFASQLIDSGASVIIVHLEYLDTAIKAAKEARIPKSRIFLFGNRAVHGFQPHSSFIGDREAEPVSYSPNEAKTTTAFLCYSSGTTGKQKGVEITHTNAVANMAQISSSGYFSIRNPFFHIYGLVFVINLVTFSGASAVVLPGFNLTTFCQCVHKYKVNFVYAVPPIILALVRSPSVESMSSVEFIFSGAAPLSENLSKDFYNIYKIPIRQGYERENCSSGVLLPNLEVKLLSEDGSGNRYDEPGELCVRGPNIVKGYLNNKEATNAAIDSDGFFHTGDIAVIDRQVAPAELESILLTHPAVGDVAVIPYFSEKELTEYPTACVVLKNEHEKTLRMSKEIQNFVNDKVAPHKKLRGGVLFLDSIPKSDSGKILRRILKDQLKKATSRSRKPLPPKKNRPDSRDWIEKWIVGFTDGAGSFDVKSVGSRLILSFEITQSAQNLRILHYIRREIGCVLPIFNQYPLLTSKYYDYIKFKKALEMLNDSSANTSTIFEVLKDSPGDVDTISSAWNMTTYPFKSTDDVKLVMSRPWLVGFVEAKASFFLKVDSCPEGDRYKHAFHVSQKGNKIVLEGVRSILHIATKILYHEKENIYEITTTNSRAIDNISRFFNYTFKGMKSLEFRIWARSINYKSNLNKLAKSARILTKIQSKFSYNNPF
ncbi:5897_t:CDS:10 [Cetraspora pellucida]|uniref:5897_t:CDS:1 n=1 Tax=Cetraspora pellucida TaxID=1433469 RepID=A0A9N9EZI3_9GLOM|nr:5897_t:CDS:10 [Cetraspora pellucida]